MSILTRFHQAITDFVARTQGTNLEAIEVRPSVQMMEMVLTTLAPVIEAATNEFAELRMGSTSTPNAALFLLDLKSTAMKSMLIFDQKSGRYYRRDELDLQLPDVIFELAGQTREETLEVHNFSYDSVEEVVEAYIQVFAWAVAQLRKERAEDGTVDASTT